MSALDDLVKEHGGWKSRQELSALRAENERLKAALETAKAQIEHGTKLIGYGPDTAYIDAALAPAAPVYPECDSAILASGYCMMGHRCEEREKE